MKNFFKKINRNQEAEQEDLNLDYSDFYMGKDSRSDRADEQRRSEDRREESAPDQRSSGGYYDVAKPARGGYEEPDFQSDNTRYYDGDRPAERPVERVVERPLDRNESAVKPRETWQEADAPGYRPNPATAEPQAEAVFTPAPAPEYLYFTPSTYRDCREGIVKGLSTGHVVVVRLRNLEANDVLRLFDYMMGAVLALDGELVRPAATTVVLVPKDVELNEDDIEPDEDELEDDEYEDEDSEEEYDDEEEYEEDEYENGEYGAYDEEESEEEYEDEEEYDEEYDEDEEYEEEYDEEDEYDEEYEDEYEEEYEEDEEDSEEDV